MRKVLAVVSGLSLLLCMSVAALWVRSYYRYDVVRRHTVAGDRYSLFSWRGTLLLEL